MIWDVVGYKRCVFNGDEDFGCSDCVVLIDQLDCVWIFQYGVVINGFDFGIGQ